MPACPQDSERGFVIDVESPSAEEETSDTLNNDEASAVIRFSLLAMVFGHITSVGRRRMQCAVALLTLIAAPTCVSVIAKAGTNSVLMTGAVTAIIAGGKFFFNALGESR